MRRACEFYLKRGFTAVKFGWGVFGQDRKRDVALVAAAREAPRCERGIARGPRLDGGTQRARRD